jgi:hypothetical protein
MEDPVVETTSEVFGFVVKVENDFSIEEIVAPTLLVGGASLQRVSFHRSRI